MTKISNSLKLTPEIQGTFICACIVQGVIIPLITDDIVPRPTAVLLLKMCYVLNIHVSRSFLNKISDIYKL